MTLAFCVQSYNTYGPAYALNTSHRTAEMIRRLRSMPSCEVIQFQEVWSPSQAHQFLQDLHPEYSIVSSPNLKFRIGLMGFYQGYSLDSQTHIFPLNQDGGLLDGFRGVFSVKKGFQVESLYVGDSREPLFFINTHLHPTSAPVRLAQILEIYHWRRAHTQQKVILTGDFNFELNSLERRVVMGLVGLQDSGEVVFQGYPPQLCTYCEENPLRWLRGNHVFDYVFYSNQGGDEQQKLKPKSAEVNFKSDREGYLSDHYGLRVQFEWENGMIPKQDSFKEKKYQQFMIDLGIMNHLFKKAGGSFVQARQEVESIYQSLSARNGVAWEFYNRTTNL